MSDLRRKLLAATNWQEVRPGNPPIGYRCLFRVGGIAFEGTLRENDPDGEGVRWWPIDFGNHADTSPADYAVRALWAEIPEIGPTKAAWLDLKIAIDDWISEVMKAIGLEPKP